MDDKLVLNQNLVGTKVLRDVILDGLVEGMRKHASSMRDFPYHIVQRIRYGNEKRISFSLDKDAIHPVAEVYVDVMDETYRYGLGHGDVTLMMCVTPSRLPCMNRELERQPKNQDWRFRGLVVPVSATILFMILESLLQFSHAEVAKEVVSE